MDNSINLVMITDKKYILTTIVAIRSIVAHVNADYCYHLYIIADYEVQKLWESEYKNEKYPDNLHISFVDASVASMGIECQHLYVSQAALLKFRIPELLPQLDKVLYMDGDILVRGDLIELYKTDINAYYAAAVKDMPTYDGDYLQSIGIKEYFNSGIMLLNLSELRADSISKKLIEEKKHQKYHRFMDQDAFNFVFKDKVLFVSPIFNYMPVALKNHSQKEYCNFYDVSEQELQKIQIIHLAGEVKPWDTTRAHGFQEWTEYLDESKDIGKCLVNVVSNDIAYLNSQIVKINGQIEEINGHIVKLYASDKELNEHVYNLNLANEELNQHIQKLYTGNEELNRHMQDLALRNNEINQELKDMYSAVTNHEKQIAYMRLPFYKKIKNKLKQRKRK